MKAVVVACDFCAKTQHQVELLVAGPRVAICSECVGVAQKVIDDARAEKASEVVQRFTYTISPRPARAGGGWRLQLFEDGQEVGGGAYLVTGEATSDDAHQDAMEDGEAWLLSCSDAPAPAATSYGLPARIDGMDSAQLRALLDIARGVAPGHTTAADSALACAGCNLTMEESLTLYAMHRGAVVLVLAQAQDEARIAASVQEQRKCAGNAGAAPAYRCGVLALAGQLAACSLPAAAEKLGAVEAVDATGEAMRRLVALETLSAMLWLYRRLPRAYGRQEHVDVVIERLARATGADVAGDLAQRRAMEGGGNG